MLDTVSIRFGEGFVKLWDCSHSLADPVESMKTEPSTPRTITSCQTVGCSL